MKHLRLYEEFKSEQIVCNIFFWVPQPSCKNPDGPWDRTRYKLTVRIDQAVDSNYLGLLQDTVLDWDVTEEVLKEIAAGGFVLTCEYEPLEWLETTILSDHNLKLDASTRHRLKDFLDGIRTDLWWALRDYVKERDCFSDRSIPLISSLLEYYVRWENLKGNPPGEITSRSKNP